VIALSEGHHLAGKSELEARGLTDETIVELGPEDEFRRKLSRALEGAGEHPRYVIDASLELTVCALVSAGCGVGIADSETARMLRGTGVVLRRFRPAIRVRIYLFRERGRRGAMLSRGWPQKVGSARASG
jgi:DNA-binding transcriptional LysR family regulator